MKQLVPGFIINQYEKKQMKGKLKSYVLVIDITGFTRIADNLITKGKEGVEILSDLINQIFSPIIDEIQKIDGFVSSFAGDSITIIFPAYCFTVSEDFIFFSNKLLKNLQSIYTLSTKFGEYEFPVKLGLGNGNVNWEILEKDYALPFFYGEAIEQASLAQKFAENNKIVISKKLFRSINSIDFKTKFVLDESGFYIQNNQELSKPKSIQKINKENNHCHRNLLPFVPKGLHDYNVEGEFRSVVSCFINFYDVNLILRNFTTLSKLVTQNGGFLNKIIQCDKGFVALVIFGAPVSREDNLVRAGNFSFQMLKKFKRKVRIGFSQGIVFAGFVGSVLRCEYTVLGKEVNKSARMMMEADWGNCIVDNVIKNRLKNCFTFNEIGKTKLKGIPDKVFLYTLSNIQNNPDTVEKLFFIGREHEQKIILNKIQKSLEGNFSGVLFVDGEAGIGKSFLFKKIECSLTRPLYWTSIICDEILHSSLFPVKNYLRTFFKLDKSIDDKEALQRIKEKFIEIRSKLTSPYIQELWNLAEPYLMELLEYNQPEIGDIDSKIKFENTLYALKNFFVVLSSLKPLVLVIDDGQWIDEDTIQFLQILIRNAEKKAITILFASRYLNDGSLFQLNLPTKKVSRIGLEHFSSNQIKEFLYRKLETTQIPENTFELFYSKTEGNPFYLEQFYLYLKDNNIFKNNFEIITKKIIIPDTISSIIISRIDKLTYQLKEVVQTASILGREFAAEVLTSMLRDIPVQKYLVEGERESIWNAITELKYIFKHALLRETVYEMQLKKRVRELHQVAAETYVNLYPNQLSGHYPEICFHFERAENQEKAIEYLNLSGEWAYNQHHISDAVSYYYRLSNLQKEAISFTSALEIEVSSMNRKSLKKLTHTLFRLGDTYMLAGDWNLAEQAFYESNAISQKLSSIEDIAFSYEKIAEIKLLKSCYDESLAACKKVEECAKILNKREITSNMLNIYGRVYEALGDFKKAKQYFEDSLKIAQADKNEELISVVLSNLGLVYSYLGDQSKAIKLFKKSMHFVEKNGYLTEMIKVKMSIGASYIDSGDLDSGEKYLQDALVMSKKIGYKHGIGICYGNLGVVKRKQRDYETALLYYQKKIDLSLEIGDKKGLNTVYTHIANVLQEKGNNEKSLEYHFKSLDLADELKDYNFKAIAYGNISEIYNFQCKYDRALELVNKAIEIDRKIDYFHHLSFVLTSKVKILFQMKQYDECLEVIKESKQLAKEVNDEFGTVELEIIELECSFALSKDQKEKNRVIEIIKQKSKTIEEDILRLSAAYGAIDMMRQVQQIDLDFARTALKNMNEIYENTGTYEVKTWIDKINKWMGSCL